jgi:hypothetical protein
MSESPVDEVQNAEFIELGLMKRVERQINNDALVNLDIIAPQGEVPSDVIGSW